MRKMSVAILGLAFLATAACVKIPGEVEAAFAPAHPGERSNFQRQPGAPSAHGFVNEDDLRVVDAGVEPPPDAGMAEASADATVPVISMVGTIEAGAPALTPEAGVAIEAGVADGGKP